MPDRVYCELDLSIKCTLQLSRLDHLKLHFCYIRSLRTSAERHRVCNHTLYKNPAGYMLQRQIKTDITLYNKLPAMRFTSHRTHVCVVGCLMMLAVTLDVPLRALSRLNSDCIEALNLLATNIAAAPYFFELTINSHNVQTCLQYCKINLFCNRAMHLMQCKLHHKTI